MPDPFPVDVASVQASEMPCPRANTRGGNRGRGRGRGRGRDTSESIYVL
jgi:hypothetical protein